MDGRLHVRQIGLRVPEVFARALPNGRIVRLGGLDAGIHILDVLEVTIDVFNLFNPNRFVRLNRERRRYLDSV